jgi:hypothetical protein
MSVTVYFPTVIGSEAEKLHLAHGAKISASGGVSGTITVSNAAGTFIGMFAIDNILGVVVDAD